MAPLIRVFSILLTILIIGVIVHHVPMFKNATQPEKWACENTTNSNANRACEDFFTGK